MSWQIDEFINNVKVLISTVEGPSVRLAPHPGFCAPTMGAGYPPAVSAHKCHFRVKVS